MLQNSWLRELNFCRSRERHDRFYTKTLWDILWRIAESFASDSETSVGENDIIESIYSYFVLQGCGASWACQTLMWKYLFLLRINQIKYQILKDIKDERSLEMSWPCAQIRPVETYLRSSIRMITIGPKWRFMEHCTHWTQDWFLSQRFSAFWWPNDLIDCLSAWRATEPLSQMTKVSEGSRNGVENNFLGLFSYPKTAYLGAHPDRPRERHRYIQPVALPRWYLILVLPKGDSRVRISALQNRPWMKFFAAPHLSLKPPEIPGAGAGSSVIASNGLV